MKHLILINSEGLYALDKNLDCFGSHFPYKFPLSMREELSNKYISKYPNEQFRIDVYEQLELKV